VRIIERGSCQRYNVSATPIKAEGVLLHTTEGGSKTYLDDLFIRNRRKNANGTYTTVSVHFCIYKDGEIRSYAPFTPGRAYYAYHAGQSWMPDGRASASRYLIGIELQHRAGQVYPRVQLEALRWLLATIQAAWKDQPSWRNTLTEHSVVAPERKSDPTYPWKLVRDEIYAAWARGGKEEDDMTPDEVRAIAREEVAAATQVVHKADEVQAAQWTLIETGLLARGRPTRAAASIGYVDLMLARLFKALKTGGEV
jgi:N-acetyl-anhydromuramyl-L-alanine amidase AmpD